MTSQSGHSTRFAWLFLLAAIWLPVVYLLGAQWSVYQEYQYGWAVPFLCLYLAGQRFSSRPPLTTPEWKSGAVILMAASALIFLVMRVLQEANPVWRLASYGLALAAVAMTLLAVYLTQGGRRARHFIFPAAFFLVAVPWPTPLETAVIQSLTRLNAGLVVEFLNFAGVPALPHGNVIEVSAGMVGIDEACSGIRSFQATLMVGLFFGEFYRLSGGRRWCLLATGPALALIFNFTRMLFLVLVAARAGLPVMERWHDPTGVVLLVGCFLSLWGVALWMERKGKHSTINLQPSTSNDPTTENGKLKAENPAFSTFNLQSPTDSPSTLNSQPSTLRLLAVAVAIWAVVVEIFNEAWFRSHEARGDRSNVWTAQWPADNSTLRTNLIPANALRMLQCDQHSSASWTGNDGVFWQGFYLRWLPSSSFYGRVKVALSKSHNPTICLPAEGLKLQAQLDPVLLPVTPGVSLWFDRYDFTSADQHLYVFFAQTEDMTGGGLANLRTTHLDRLRAALAGSRNYGQNNFEVALTGSASPADALRIFSTRLPALVKVQMADEPAEK